MMLALVCVLFGFAWLIDRRGLRRFSRVLGLASLLLVFAVGCGPLPSWMLQHLQRTGVNDFNAWGARNVIVLLGAGTVRPEGRDAVAEANLFAYGRIVESARLYWQCRHSGGDCKIEISGGDARGLGLSEAVVYQRVLLGLGIPRADLIMEPSSMNTWQNALFSQPLLRAYRPVR
ncbi:YdcF family protein, partial [Xanthomonas perforans]|uniref:YdcF family protein n=1 Tax=Xanthomonas perforans TaxID=442694 RepID=UPI001F20FD4B